MKKKKKQTASLSKDELQKQLKRKDSAVERMKRKLKIEAALERVRARTMVMQHSGELSETAVVLFDQFNLLGEAPERMAVEIVNEKENVFEIWATEHGGSQLNLLLKVSLDEPHVMKKMYKAWKQQKKSITIDLKGKALEEYFQFLNKAGLPVQREVFGKRRVQNVATFSKGILTIITPEPRSAETIRLLERFAAVFDGTYIRFLDLQKAEAQTREAQIEVALERVRSRTMAMQKSEELQAVIKSIYEQLVHLGFEMASAGFVMDYKETNDLNVWVWRQGQQYSSLLHVPYLDHPIFNLLIEAKEKGLDFYTVTLSKEEKDTLYRHLFHHISGWSDERKTLLYNMPGYADSHALMKNVILYIQNFTGIPYSDAENAVLMRFGKVFEQTYTRFTDLKKAEEQSREAQIQLALERARTQSMIMQHSNELDDTLRVFHEQVLLLGIKSAFSFLWLPDEEKDRHIFWAAWAENNSTIFKSKAIIYLLDRNEPATKQCLIDWKSNEPVVSYQVSPASVKDYFAVWSELIAGVEELKAENFSDGLYYVEAFMKYGCFGVMAKNALSEDEKKILGRFAIEFERAYTRFLDLQKAEAQAREAQIEAALERVRSRTMAMHKSDELAETAVVMFKQLIGLGIAPNRLYISIINDDSGDLEFWITDENGDKLSSRYLVNINKNISIKKMYEGWAEKKKTITIDMQGKELEDWLTYWKEQFHVAFKPGAALKRRVQNIAFFSKGFIAIASANEQSQTTVNLLERFAGVFNITYTRFLDLQKAEAQAREAQIELSLERVRAKTMAMHNSQDVGDTVATLFEEFVKLGISTNRCGILIHSDSPITEVWTAKSNDSENATLIIGQLDTKIHPMLQGVRKGWENKESFFSYELKGEDIKAYYRAINEAKYYPTKFDLSTLPLKEFHSDFYFAEGCIFAFTAEPISVEASVIFKRFAGVFGQTYRRYLDLQKAEAQARESQIELSLERVRAKTMAMHNSQDVGDTVAVMFDEVVKLDIETIRCGIGIMHEPGEMEVWTAKPDENGKVDLIIGRMDMMMHPLLQGAFNGWRNKQEFYTYELIGDDLIDYFTAINNHSDYPIKYDIASLPSKIIHSEFHFPEGTLFVFSLEKLSAEALKIFKRFAGVFGQTYRRYLDLKKAEAQARSSQTEAAMEKVRARSLAMQKPEELIEVAEVLRKEMGSLGIEELETSSIYILDDTKETAECWYAIKDIRRDDKKLVSDHMIVNLHDTWVGREMLQFYSSSQKQISILMQGQNRKEWINYCAAHSKVLQGYFGDEIPERTYHLVKFSNGYMGAASPGNISRESWDLLKRATAVFSFAYTRFLDLQKAEAQTREAQIELALERVRARTMAMFKSDELAETAAVLFRQLIGLGIMQNRLFIGVINDESGDMEAWATNEEGDKVSKQFVLSAHRNHSIKKMYDGWKSKMKSIVIDMHGKELENYFHYLNDEMHVPFSIGLEQKRRVQHIAYFSKGFIGMASPDEQPSSTINLLERFASVFNLTYTRFTDLQQAEAQAREAQIETGLERVRSRAMAMHKTDELLDAAELVYKELSMLGVASMSINYAFVDEDEKNASYYSINPVDGKIPPFPFIFPHTETDVMRAILAGWKEQGSFNLIELDEETTLKHQTYIGEIIKKVMSEHDIPFSVEAFLEVSPKKAVIYTFNFSKGYLFIIGSVRLTKPQEEMVLRFTKVFEMTYRRFLDLKQAEAQAREAKIEASLERVRSKAMAMHSSKDLTDTIIAFYRELESLSVTPRRCGVGLINKETHIAEISSMNTTEQGDSIAVIGNLDLTSHSILKGIYDSWLLQKDYYPVLRGSAIKEYYQILTPQIDYPDYPKDVVQYGHFFFFAEGGVYAWTEKQMTENELKIYRRFTSVLTLTYKRYKDLKQAEEQAREATIEAALERVRGKAMAMRNSDDLSSAASMVFTELRKLGINPIRSGVGIISNESRRVEFYSAMSSANGDSLSLTGGVIMSGHPEFEKQYDSWLRKENHFIALKGEELKSYYKFLFAGLNIESDPNNESNQEQYGHWLMFSEGFLFAWSDKAYSEAEISILDRFKKIVELTFRRYIELQKSEINARDAVKQAALDRVRADIASMRTTTDLEKITPLIWNELTILGIPFIRCGVFIMDDSQELIHTFLSTPDGKAIAAFHIPYDTPGNINQVLKHWQQKENYIDHWDDKAFKDFADTLVKQGALASSEQYLQTIPHGGFHLHFLPFLQGMLYVGNSNRLDDEEIKLIQSVADAFSTAYARYEDFNKLEAAKQTVEKTLVDLKQAQQQLVQSEKMASLGELTAGIAHEIQNPLNFVNNFSEVSNELMDEMNIELENGDIEEAKAIAIDIKQNLEKINHHGKRADGIVKGMLQHSRSSSGHKELTDINVLADEYIRLCYHGLRAKDKSFNSAIKTDFDNAIEKINIVPQDIGRVLLNLYTNAFYAVNEKRKTEGSGYEPTVSVSTQKSGYQIYIVVRDNGNGISQKIVDKIFQPFFTTKPTGQGTGLGLSLSYDIVKAHGGEIKVKTIEGQGSEFVIHLPNV